MKRLFVTGYASLMASVCLAPEGGNGSDPDLAPTAGRGLEASLDWEANQKAASAEFATGTIGQNRGLNASLAAAGQERVSDALGLGLTGKVTPVSRTDCEGLLMIDSFTGRVIEDENTPEWAHDLGVFCAVPGERHIWYGNKIGPTLYTAEMRMPELLAFEDLDWMAIDPETGAEKIIEADYEHRANVVAAILGIDRDESKESGHVSGDAVSMEISYDNSRTGEEMTAFTEAQGRHFEEVKKTGTHG